MLACSLTTPESSLEALAEAGVGWVLNRIAIAAAVVVVVVVVAAAAERYWYQTPQTNRAVAAAAG